MFHKDYLGAAGRVGYASEIRKAFASPDIADLPYSAAVQAGDTIYVSGVLGMNAIFAATFRQNVPARSMIIVPAIPLDAAVEIECNALVHVE